MTRNGVHVCDVCKRELPEALLATMRLLRQDRHNPDPGLDRDLCEECRLQMISGAPNQSL